MSRNTPEAEVVGVSSEDRSRGESSSASPSTTRTPTVPQAPPASSQAAVDVGIGDKDETKRHNSSNLTDKFQRKLDKCNDELNRLHQKGEDAIHGPEQMYKVLSSYKHSFSILYREIQQSRLSSKIRFLKDPEVPEARKIAFEKSYENSKQKGMFKQYAEIADFYAEKYMKTSLFKGVAMKALSYLIVKPVLAIPRALESAVRATPFLGSAWERNLVEKAKKAAEKQKEEAAAKEREPRPDSPSPRA